MRFRACLLLAALAFAGCNRGGATASGLGARAASLERSLAALAVEGDGILAVSVMHLPSGAVASVNGSRRMPMMSVFKLPLAIVTLAAIDDGARSMSESVPLTRDELRSSVSPVADAWKRGETAPSLERILRTVLEDSDNTSGDKLVTMNGGGPTVTARLRKLGIDGVDVAEEEIDIAARLSCQSASPSPAKWTEAALERCPKASAEARARAASAEVASPPNGATADALVAMLAMLDRGDVLSAKSRGWLTAAMQATRTGPMRIRAGLPEGTRLAHRTGTGDTVSGMTVARNDIGIVTLPDGSRLALAILTAGTRADEAQVEARMAKAARVAWDAFVDRVR
jgi:beta-lactamase class A